MKKSFLSIIVGFVAISCTANKFQKKELFPLQIRTDSVLVINLDSTKIIKNIDSLICTNNMHRISNLLPVGYINIRDFSLPIQEPRFSICPYFRGISCFKEATFITVKRDSFHWSGESYLLNVKNVEKHLTQRFLYPETMYLSDPRFSVFSIEMSENENIDKGLLEFQLTTISDSYYNFFYKNISGDSIGYYKKRYPFNLTIERPWNEVFTAVPPPKP